MEAHRDPPKGPADTKRIGPSWIREKEKNKGVHNKGHLTGFYVDESNPIRKILFKQGSNPAETIAEFVTAKLSRLFNPDALHLFADVSLAVSKEKCVIDETGKEVVVPDEIGNEVYVGSLIFVDSVDLYVDAYRAYNQSLPDDRPSIAVPSARPGWLVKDKIINSMILRGRYPEFHKIAVTALITEDMDINSANILVRPGENAKGVEEKIYDKVQAVRIDFGCGLKNLDENLHLFEMLRYYACTPPNYFLTYEPKIFGKTGFLIELIKFSVFPVGQISKGITDILNELVQFFGKKPLFEFAVLIGVNNYIKKEKNTTIDIDTPKYHLISYIDLFLRHMFIARTLAAEHMALAIVKELNISMEEFTWMKERSAEEFKKHFPKQFNEEQQKKSIKASMTKEEIEKKLNELGAEEELGELGEKLKRDAERYYFEDPFIIKKLGEYGLLE